MARWAQPTAHRSPLIMPLTDIKIRQAKPAGKPLKLTDTAGLYLEVRLNGSKLGRYRYRIDGRENLFAIGEYPRIGWLPIRSVTAADVLAILWTAPPSAAPRWWR